jgi:tetratricopeptide (TPR) repeat protein
MRCSRAIAVTAVLAICGGSWASAAAKHDPAKERPPLGNNPNPVIWTSTKPKPATPPPQPRPKAPPQAPHRGDAHDGGDRHQDGRDGRYWYRRPGIYAGYGYYPYGYWPGYDDPYGLGVGLQDSQQFDDTADARRARANANARMVERDDPPKRRDAERAAADRSNELALKSIEYGDALFAKGKYVEANERYRKAARIAPKLATAYFRQGFALAAAGRCDPAAAAVKRGLKLDPAWPKSNFELGQLFGANAAAKDARLDALAAVAMDKAADANRLFMLGVFLHFDGQPDRAAATFARAEKAAGNHLGHIEAFLPK